MRTVKYFLLLTLVFIALSGKTQDLPKVEGSHRYKAKVVRKKPPVKKTKIYHPAWGPKFTFRNRWLYFPRYNFYWDNVQNVYIIKRGNAWVVLNSKPKEVEKVDLVTERIVELNDEENKTDAIQEKNSEHKAKYKVQ